MHKERKTSKQDNEGTRIIQVNNSYSESNSDSVDKVLLFLFAFGVIGWIYAVFSI